MNCPHCNFMVTGREWQGGICPSCVKKLPPLVPTVPASRHEETGAESPSKRTYNWRARHSFYPVLILAVCHGLFEQNLKDASPLVGLTYFIFMVLLLGIGLILGIMALISGIQLKNWTRIIFAVLGIAFNGLGLNTMLAIATWRSHPPHRQAGLFEPEEPTSRRQIELKTDIASCTELIRTKPDADAYNDRGVAYFELREYDKALTDFNSALEIDRDYLPSRQNRGRVYINLKKYQLAIDDFSAAIRLDPNAGDVYWMRGCAHDLHGELDAAIDDYTSAIDHSFRTLASYSCRAIIYEKKQQWRKAADDYSAAITVEPGNPVGYMGRQHCYEKLGESDKAKEDATRAKQLAHELGYEP